MIFNSGHSNKIYCLTACISVFSASLVFAAPFQPDKGYQLMHANTNHKNPKEDKANVIGWISPNPPHDVTGKPGYHQSVNIMSAKNADNASYTGNRDTYKYKIGDIQTAMHRSLDSLNLLANTWVDPDNPKVLIKYVSQIDSERSVSLMLENDHYIVSYTDKAQLRIKAKPHTYTFETLPYAFIKEPYPDTVNLIIFTQDKPVVIELAVTQQGNNYELRSTGEEVINITLNGDGKLTRFSRIGLGYHGLSDIAYYNLSL